MKVRDFLKINCLKQVDIARYLGVTEAAISNVVKGKSEFSKENLIKIINNPHGWDTTMLVESDQSENPVVEKPEERSIIDRLFMLIENLRAENKLLLDIIREKDEKMEELRNELDARKGKTASGAAGSSDATAV